MRQSSILIHLFFSTSVLSLMMFCVTALNSSCDKPPDLLQQLEIAYDL